jgi:hypothetical protein
MYVGVKERRVGQRLADARTSQAEGQEIRDIRKVARNLGDELDGKST